jgi:4-carboxymuconolactone decarboxylase
MTRIQPVSIEDTSEDIEASFQYLRAGFAQMTGKDNEAMLAPLQVLAHVPSLVQPLLGLAQASGGLKGLPHRYAMLATLRASTMTHCEYCIDLTSAISQQSGFSEEELLALANYQTSHLFSDLDKLVLDYATGVSQTPVEVSDALFEALQEHFDEGQLVELTHHIALENLYGRFNHALGIGASGLTEGMVCAVPASVG